MLKIRKEGALPVGKSRAVVMWLHALAPCLLLQQQTEFRPFGAEPPASPIVARARRENANQILARQINPSEQATAARVVREDLDANRFSAIAMHDTRVRHREFAWKTGLERLNAQRKSIRYGLERQDLQPFLQEAAMLSRDDLIREARARGGSLPALVLVYAAILGTMAGTALAII